jgi:hypothetical protein
MPVTMNAGCYAIEDGHYGAVRGFRVEINRRVAEKNGDSPEPAQELLPSATILKLRPRALNLPVQRTEDGGLSPSADRPITESEIDKLHSEAFGDLEPAICDCVSMAKIAAQMMFAKDDGTDRELVFAVAHVSEMLAALKTNYYAAWHGALWWSRLSRR